MIFLPESDLRTFNRHSHQPTAPWSLPGCTLSIRNCNHHTQRHFSSAISLNRCESRFRETSVTMQCRWERLIAPVFLTSRRVLGSKGTLSLEGIGQVFHSGILLFCGHSRMPSAMCSRESGKRHHNVVSGNLVRNSVQRTTNIAKDCAKFDFSSSQVPPACDPGASSQTWSSR